MKQRDESRDITVLERNPVGVTYGWGVVFWDDLLDQLRATDPTTARQISESSFQWSGERLAVEGKHQVEADGDGYAIGRQRLLDLLVGRALDLGVRVQFEFEVEHFSQLAGADVIVGSDGVNSRVRKLHEHEFRTSIRAGRNKYIWLGTSKVFDAFTFAFVETDAGWIWCHAYGFDDRTSTFIVEVPPETWQALGFDRMGEEETIRLLEHLFESALDGHPLRSHSRASGAARWLSFRTLTNETWHHDNTVLMGDAAHTTHFTIGSGTKLALEDAITLADKLNDCDDLQRALTAYETERRTALRAAQSDARFSRLWFENIERYAALDPMPFFALLRERRSPLLPRVPPPLYYRAYQATQRFGVLLRLRKWAAPRIKALFFRGPF
jgi:2-polyprenyl-6-methoxyphenol hydroxylase-like FAD-dependent oxidoreductase